MIHVDYTFTEGREPGQWQSLDEKFVLRCPWCRNRFSVKAFHLVAEEPRRPTLWNPKCPHAGCGWRMNVVELAGAAPERLRILAEVSDSSSGEKR